MNLSGDLNLKSTQILNNTSLSGYGGGISLVTDQKETMMNLESCIISENIAQKGGGLYLEF